MGTGEKMKQADKARVTISLAKLDAIVDTLVYAGRKKAACMVSSKEGPLSFRDWARKSLLGPKYRLTQDPDRDV